MLKLVKNSNGRMLAAYQAYSQMFKDRLEPIIQQEWIAHTLGKRTEEEKAKPIPRAPMTFRNEVAKRLLAKEPQEVQAQVEKWRQDERDRDKKVEDEDDEEAQRLSTNKRYHK